MPSSYSIGAHFEKMAKDLVASGRYASVSEVLRAGLRMVEHEEQDQQARLDETRKLIREGLESGDAGPLEIEAIIAEARQHSSESAA